MDNPLINTSLQRETFVISDTALGLSDMGFDDDNIAAATSALITANVAGVLFSCDGEAPVTGAGHVIPEGATVELSGPNIVRNLEFLRLAADDATLTISLLGPSAQKAAITT